MNLEQTIERVLNLLPSSGILSEEKEREFVDLLQEKIPALLQSIVPPQTTISGHAKMGFLADVPWIGLVPKDARFDTSPQTGVYLTLLFRVDGSGFYVSIQHGAEACGISSTRNASAGMRQFLQPSELREKTIQLLPNPPDKFGKKSYARPKKYEAANLAAKFFAKPIIVDDLTRSIAEGLKLLESYGEILMNIKAGNEAPPVCNRRSNFKSSLISACVTKPFLILTGNSGTGKTKLAERLAETYRKNDDKAKASNSALVAVGADWTDNRSVVGFVNHLRDVAQATNPEDKRAVYQSTPVLDLLLNANENPNWPHFLILDEMNLSHVERYFADFLSAMEARDGVIHLHTEGSVDDTDFRLPRFAGDTVGVPRQLSYPKNLFVIGTVNVDETTYMFSPKVLDRAHVIEFAVDPEAIRVFLDDPKPLESAARASESEAKAFLELSKSARNLDGRSLEELPAGVAQKINDHLLDLLDLLQRARFEFAFRTANEVNIYLRICRHLAEDKAAWDAGGWKPDLDDEILQKILPRLHGSRTRIGSLLGALGSYLHNGDRESAWKYFPAPGEEIPEQAMQEIIRLDEGGATFPRSFRKIQQMVRVVVEEQFVSFIC